MTQIREYYPSGNTPVAIDPHMAVKTEFGRLMHAAIISKRFRENLLANPVQSIEAGFCGESFHFTHELTDRIQHIHAASLEEFSCQLLQVLNNHSLREMTVIQYQ